ncbi:MAG: hypothetical protein IJ841_08490 [Prevotella sp.]|nr:hypothetical protein [Prevotella sp.]
MKKGLYSIVFLWAIALSVFAQHDKSGQKFSPEQFDAELKQFIIQEAALTQQESAKFFPVYQEMQGKLRAVYGRQRQLGQVKPADEKGCTKIIQERDNLDVELKRIQQSYHNRFLDLLPASKVYDVIKAEERFHRRKFKQWSHTPKKQ